MDLEKVLETVSGKTFSSQILSTKKTVYGKLYTVEDDMMLANVAALDDKQFFYAQLLKLVAEKYSLKPTDMKSMSVKDIQWLAKDLRIHSDGNELELLVDCGACNKRTKCVVDLSKIVYKLPDGETSDTIDIGASCIIKLTAPSYDVEISHETVIDELTAALKENKKDPEQLTKAVSKNLELFVKSIESVSVGTETQRAQDMDRAALENFIRKLPRKAIKQFVRWYGNQPTIELEQDLVCTNKECGKKLRLDFDDFFDSLL